MRTVEDQLAAILDRIRPLTPLAAPLLDAHGCVLAEDVAAGLDLPGFDNSAMDGYAVRAADTADANADEPVRLTVTADIPAGTAPTRPVGPGEAARIMTGAPVPDGADAIVPVEHTDGGTDHVRIHSPAAADAFIRRRGEDIAEGSIVLRGGVAIGARQVALLAAVGRERVRVRPRPRVLVLSTGSELVPPGSPVDPGRIHDSNSFTLAAAVAEAGGVPCRIDAVPDDPATLTATLDQHLPDVDAVVTSGGVSVGAYDVVKEVLSRHGTVDFTRVAVQPGMPQGFGTLGPAAVPIFTLPGNPVSAYVSFELFVRPALRLMQGHTHLHRPHVVARCTAPLNSPPGRRQYARARLDTDGGNPTVAPVGGAGSHLLGGLARADCLIVVPEDITRVEAGTSVDVMLLEGTPPSASEASPHDHPAAPGTRP